jgi:hypothetical protein
LFAVWDKFGIAGQNLYPIQNPCSGYVEISLVDHKELIHCRVAKFRNFPPNLVCWSLKGHSREKFLRLFLYIID